MRRAFVQTLARLAEADPSVHLITADTGFHVFDDFQRRFPNQYLNIGVSEAAMIGVAAGLALSGKRVFIYGIIPFITLRCLEQIKIDVCFQRLPVTLVGVGGGLTYGAEGPTHHAIDDIAIMNALPGMTIICPHDPGQAGWAVEASMQVDGPVYLRIGKSGLERVDAQPPSPNVVGKGKQLGEEGEAAIIAAGSILETALQTAEILRGRGLSSNVIDMHTLKPIDRELLIQLGRTCRLIVTIEEHSETGGLGSIVADVICRYRLDVSLLKFALPDRVINRVGSRSCLLERFGLTPTAIAEAILKATDD